ncbi:Ppx/GppA family phosphatase [Sphingomonas sp. So64.6b]|uniref:Ppx/GppA family phosphatase n=1 Tax=Sphingomonas sp. So64.6b TaxID=2997354 RepID=UPI001602D786|nr:Ppx/GppA family phosphatase [Sphingomonas sp. So64.6b]QNA83938.1 Ppx/GppA family phosphatase [Sphingomonas sp. So64.6b]
MPTLLFRKPKLEPQAEPRTGIIDIGSNSIRLVIYQGPERLPAILFNEKVMAGLGRGLSETGAIGKDGLAKAGLALARFAAVAREMEVSRLRTVATAAVRDASNGGTLIDTARKLGLEVELLSGEQEAMAAGHGVLSAIPDAEGIVGDLGGGSLELVRVSQGQVRDRVSFPFGVLRVGPIRTKGGQGALDRQVAKAIKQAGWTGKGQGLPLYLVGGSWRALARLDMHINDYPLPVIHQYAMPPLAIARMNRTISHVAKGRLRTIPGLSSARAATLGDGAALLSALIKHLGSETTIVSAFGLREGLLYGDLDPAMRSEDPLIVATRDEGRRHGRFVEHGDLLDEWIAPLFAGDPPEMARLRHAACQLADVGWRANPEFRAERGVEIALHGNWVAIDARGRALMAQALFTSLGGGTDTPAPISELAPLVDLKRATAWGLAMRLGQRLSGGLAGPLLRSHLHIGPTTLSLHLEPRDAALYGEAVERRHKALAVSHDREPVLITSG